MFGLSVQTVYLYGLIICGSLTFLYILFSDLLDGLSEAIPFFNPTLLFSFLTFFFLATFSDVFFVLFDKGVIDSFFCGNRESVGVGVVVDA